MRQQARRVVRVVTQFLARGVIRARSDAALPPDVRRGYASPLRVTESWAMPLVRPLAHEQLGQSPNQGRSPFRSWELDGET